MPMQLSMDIAVDPLYGFVKAVRIVNSCGEHRNMVCDSERSHIHIDLEGDIKAFLRCIEGIRGYASADIKALFTAAMEGIERKVLKELGWKVVPQALSQRVIAYLPRAGYSVVLEKTGKQGIYIARIARVREIPLPPPPSIYMVFGTVEEVARRGLEIAEILEKEVNELIRALSERGYTAQL